jgi:hypothetical protein
MIDQIECISSIRVISGFPPMNVLLLAKKKGDKYKCEECGLETALCK